MAQNRTLVDSKAKKSGFYWVLLRTGEQQAKKSGFYYRGDCFAWASKAGVTTAHSRALQCKRTRRLIKRALQGKLDEAKEMKAKLGLEGVRLGDIAGDSAEVVRKFNEALKPRRGKLQGRERTRMIRGNYYWSFSLTSTGSRSRWLPLIRRDYTQITFSGCCRSRI